MSLICIRKTMLRIEFYCSLNAEPLPPSHRTRAQVSKSESVLQAEDGVAVRIVNVLSLHVINSAGHVSASRLFVR